VAKIAFEPSWKSKHESSEGEESCQLHHFGYQEKGRLHVVSNGGKWMDIVPGVSWTFLLGIPAGLLWI
jgi:hypothetical protein